MPLKKRQSPSGTVVLAVRRILTCRDVSVIRRFLAAGGPSPELVVDLREAPAPLAPALVDLALAAKEAGGRLHLLGLTAASERLLRMLGIELGPRRDGPPPGRVPWEVEDGGGSAPLQRASG